MHSKSYWSIFLPYLQDHGYLRSNHFATMATRRSDFSSMLSLKRIFKRALLTQVFFRGGLPLRSQRKHSSSEEMKQQHISLACQEHV